jgi:hypothetical protein
MNDSDENRPKYYSNAWICFEGGLERTFGKLSRSKRLLFIPFRNIEIGCDCFDTLCLKASPASLKTLCRSVIRSGVKHSQTNIESPQLVLPKSLVEFLKYPLWLKTGEFLLKGEKLVNKDGNVEVGIDDVTGELVCKEGEETRFVVAKDVDMVCLHRFHVVFYSQSTSRASKVHAVYDLSSYRFLIEWDKFTWKIE